MPPSDRPLSRSDVEAAAARFNAWYTYTLRTSDPSIAAAWVVINRLVNHFLAKRLDYCEELLPAPLTPRDDLPGYGGYGDPDERPGGPLQID